jgi:hypothetical protein
MNEDMNEKRLKHYAKKTPCELPAFRLLFKIKGHLPKSNLGLSTHVAMVNRKQMNL